MYKNVLFVMNKAKKDYVKKDMLMVDILMQYPEVAPILMGYGLHCVGCHFSGADTLEIGAKMHGMDEETIEMMLKDANAIAEKFEKAKSKTETINKK